MKGLAGYYQWLQAQALGHAHIQTTLKNARSRLEGHSNMSLGRVDKEAVIQIIYDIR